MAARVGGDADEPGHGGRAKDFIGASKVLIIAVIDLIALVPGGLPEMSLIAISPDADPSFVSLHHLCRMVIIAMSAPLIPPVWLSLSKTVVEKS